MCQVNSEIFKDFFDQHNGSGCCGAGPAATSSCSSFKSVNTSEEECTCAEDSDDCQGGSGRNETTRRYTCTCQPCCQCTNCPFFNSPRPQEEDECFSDNQEDPPLDATDREYMEKLKCLVEEEKRLTNKIQQLECQKGKGGVVSNPCNTSRESKMDDTICGESGGSDLKQILKQINCFIHKENKKLGVDLENAKKNMESCLTGAPARRIVSSNVDSSAHTKKILELQRKLECACEKMQNLDQVNADLRKQICCLKRKCGIEDECSADDDDEEEEEDLRDLACQISQILKDMENCELCQTVPTDLKCTVQEIKNMAEMVYSRISKDSDECCECSSEDSCEED